MLLPSSKDYPANRLFSLDLLRGIDMFYLVAFCPFLSSILKANGLKGLNNFFAVHNWGGFTLYDLIMPLFIFACGAAIPLAMKRRLDAEGRPTRAFHVHVWSRFALLWFMGMLTQGNLEKLDLHQLSPFSNTLQMIAVGYVVAAYVLLAKSWWVRILIPVLLALGYGLFVHFGGDYTAEGVQRISYFIVITALLVIWRGYSKWKSKAKM